MRAGALDDAAIFEHLGRDELGARAFPAAMPAAMVEGADDFMPCRDAAHPSDPASLGSRNMETSTPMLRRQQFARWSRMEVRAPSSGAFSFLAGRPPWHKLAPKTGLERDGGGKRPF